MAADLSGRIALITGAGGGLGGAMSLALARAGATVAAADVNTQALDALRQQAGADGARIRPFAVDLADKAECARLVPRVLSEAGGLHMLVNNAGVGMKVVDPDFSVRPTRFWQAHVDNWQTLFDVNTRAPLILAQAAVRHFLSQDWGRVVNVTTSFDTMIEAKLWAYGQSKAALEAATAAWAEQMSSTSVTVNVLVPGGPANTALLPSNTVMPRDKLIEPEVMGPPIVWLASDDANGFNNRRLVARYFDTSLPAREAADMASAPVAWPDYGIQAVLPIPR